MKVWASIWASDNILFAKWSANDVSTPSVTKSWDMYDCFDKEIVTYLLTNYLVGKEQLIWTCIEI